MKIKNMHVVKLFDTKKFSLLSKAIDRIILELNHPWRFDRMVFILDNNNFFEVREETVDIHLDYNIIYHDDERYIKTSIVRILFSLINTLSENSSGIKIIDEILANREMVKRGFGDDLFYYYYLKFSEKTDINTFENYIDVNIPCLSLEGYDAQVLKEMTDRLSPLQYRKAFQRKAKKLFDVLGSDLANEANRKEAIKWCKRKISDGS